MLTLDDLRIPMGETVLSAGFSLQPGQRVAILGPSGAGKSSLLDAIAGFRAPVSGRLAWHGQDLTTAAPQDRPFSILFQDHNLFPHLSVARNLGLALRPDGRKPDADEALRIDDALTRVGLAGLGARVPGNLSGGQQSRAALARVLLQARPVLLLDEPFSALGPALKTDMLDLVQEVASGLGALVLMVTHAPQDALRFADQTVLVADGLAHPPAPTQVLFDNPPDALRVYLGSG